LFVMRGNEIEVHIQIQYEGEADRFGWVIPVQSLPEVSVGSDPLFRNLLDASVPMYGFTRQFDDCSTRGDDPQSDGAASTAGSSTSAGGDDGGNGGPDILLQETVGAFDIVVLDGQSVEQVVTWLEDNGYQTDPASEPILQQYLDEGHLFAAVRLTGGADTDEIHPIVLKFQSDEPCVPLRLTAIAATEDMDVRTFFLTDSRVVPQSYKHVLVNPLKIDWPNSASNYKEVITMAVDAEAADGNAFVTEYAGASNVVSRAGIFRATWDAAPFAAMVETPVQVVDTLTSQSLMACDVDWDLTCTTFHPLLQPLLDQYVPVPEGIEPVDFYNCMTCFEELIDLEAWDAAAFAQAIDERIIKPGIVATGLLDANPYLTRMYTTISPHEMNADPMFRANPTLPEVVSLRMSNQRLHCDGSTTVQIPDGREVYFPAGEALVWPAFQDEMPWEEAVDQEGMAAQAPLISLVDNTEQINELLDQWNKAKGQEVGGDDETGGSELGSNEAGSCGCTTDDGGPAGGALFGLATFGLFGLLRRRRG
jgi:MYXO-CTERM domain-containing protein